MERIKLHVRLTYDQIWDRIEDVTDEVMINEQYKEILIADKYNDNNDGIGTIYNTYKYYTNKTDLIKKLYELLYTDKNGITLDEHFKREVE